MRIVLGRVIKLNKQTFKNFKFDYSYIIIALSCLMIMTSLGFCSTPKTLYLTAITDALGFSRGAFSLTDAFRYATTTIMSLYFGKLVHRFGTKILMCAGFVFAIVSSIINANAEKLYIFYIASILLGIGLSFIGTAMVSIIINNWCKKNIGTVTGLTLSANGLGGAISTQVLSPIIFQEGNPFGYKSSFLLVSLILFITMILILIFYREKPKNSDLSDLEISQKKKKARGSDWIGMDYDKAIKKPYFYIALLDMFFIGFSLQGLSGIAVPHMYDIGLKVEFVALIYSFSAIILTVAKLTTGVMFDKLGMRFTMNFSFICSFVAVFCLIFLTNSPLGNVLAFTRGIIGSFALPLETVMLPLFASELFGKKCFTSMVGFFVAASSVGFALGYPFGNICHDIFGTYYLAFAVFSVMMIFVTITMQFVLSAAHKDKKAILAEEASKLEVI